MKTQQERVLAILIREQGWLPTYDFQNRFDIFVGHRGPARISELANQYPDMIEQRKMEGKKTYEYRFKVENSHLFFDMLPPKLRKIVLETVRGAKIPMQRYVMKPIYNRESNSVTLIKVLDTE